MKVGAGAKHRLAALLLSHAESRLRRWHPQWAAAMKAESVTLASNDERLRWSWGCALASYRAPRAFDWILYPTALAAGIMLITAYQWSADESLRTVAVLALVGIALGALQPRRSLISGVATGLVVAAVNSFETLSGVRPAYETAHGLVHDARWVLLIAPAVTAAVVGGYAGRKLRSSTGSTS